MTKSKGLCIALCGFWYYLQVQSLREQGQKVEENLTLPNYNHVKISNIYLDLYLDWYTAAYSPDIELVI